MNDVTLRVLRDASRKVEDARLRRRRALRSLTVVALANVGVVVGWVFIGLWISSVASHGDRGEPIVFTCTGAFIGSLVTGGFLLACIGDIATRNDELTKAERAYEDVEL